MEIIKLLTDNTGFFLNLLKDHIFVSFIAVVIAICLGALVGIYISEHPRSANVVLGVVNILYTIPSIALLGILIGFTGVGKVTAIVALTIYALLPMVRNTYTGLHHVDPLIVEAAVGMGSTPKQVLYRVKLPLAMPVILSGVRNMVTMTIALSGIASFVGAGGLGVAIYRGITTNNSSMTLLGSLLIALLALVCDFLLGLAEKGLLKRRTISKRSLVVVLAILLLFAAGGGIRQLFMNPRSVHIATKPTTEGYILGEIIAQLIREKTDIEVKITHGVGGGTSNIHPAMVKGEFDIYPEYTGTIWQIILKKNEAYDESKFDQMAKEYQETYGLVWANLFGFNDTYGIAVRRELAEEHGLKNLSDLQRVADRLIFAAQYDFYEREDGFRKLADVYELKFKQEMDMDNGLKYQAMKDKKIDVMNVFTTDGQLVSADVAVLHDDKHLYPSYLGGTVIRQEVLDRYPELAAVLKLLDHTLDDESMSALNHRVESGGERPEDVAKDFLEEIGLIGAKK